MKKVILGQFYGKDVFIEVEEVDDFPYIEAFKEMWDHRLEEGRQMEKDDQFLKSLKNLTH